MPVQIAPADVNHDGIDDLLVVIKWSNNVQQVLVNRSTEGSAAINFDTYALAMDTSPESMAIAEHLQRRAARSGRSVYNWTGGGILQNQTLKRVGFSTTDGELSDNSFRVHRAPTNS